MSRVLRLGVAVQSHLGARTVSTLKDTLNPLPASFFRGGTSKGIFINREYLPADRAEWDRIFLGIMGSPDAEYGRQLNGMGGGVSSLSKVVVVGAPRDDAAQDVDVEYTFAQVGIRDAVVDYSGNCGNLSSVVGVFALDERLCAPRLAGAPTGCATVRALNTNTAKVVATTFPVVDDLEGLGPVPELALCQTAIAGVSGTASTITLDFADPAGARTGKLLPSGHPTDSLDCAPGGNGQIAASLIDATNPSVFVRDTDVRRALGLPAAAPLDFTDARVLDLLEAVRRAGAVRMGLIPDAQAQPKIAVLSAPAAEDATADIVVRALSMGVLHKAVPMTLGLCLGVAASVSGSIPWEMLQEKGKERSGMLRVRHPGGVVEVGAEFGEDGMVKSAKVVRTGRRLMEGLVWW
jgi:2-methylaconitate cis-trans-isomerase PrpF